MAEHSPLRRDRQRRPAGSCIATASLWILCCCHPSRSEAQPSLRDRFPAEAPPAWAEAAELNENIEVEVVQSFDNRTETEKWRETRHQIVKARGPMILQHSTITTSLDDKRTERADVINDRRSFALRRKDDAPWNLVLAGQTDDADIKHMIDRKARLFILWPWRLAEWSFPSMMKGSGFRLDKVEEVQEGDRALVKVSFGFRADEAEHLPVIKEGWVVLNPQRRWAIERFETTMQSATGESARLSVVNEYQPGQDVIPRSAKMTIGSLDKPRGSEQSIDFVKYERRLVPPEEFTLTAFGLPEPDEVPVLFRGGLRLALISIGIVCLLLAIVLRRRTIQAQ